LDDTIGEYQSHGGFFKTKGKFVLFFFPLVLELCLRCTI